MDEADTTFDERVSEVRRQRRESRQEVGGLSALDEVTGGQAHPIGTDPVGQPTFRTTDTDDEIAQLRRDVSRLEGKIDALLEALEVQDGDE
jgi:hypothetical protein